LKITAAQLHFDAASLPLEQNPFISPATAKDGNFL